MLTFTVTVFNEINIHGYKKQDQKIDVKFLGC